MMLCIPFIISLFVIVLLLRIIQVKNHRFNEHKCPSGKLYYYLHPPTAQDNLEERTVWTYNRYDTQSTPTSIFFKAPWGWEQYSLVKDDIKQYVNSIDELRNDNDKIYRERDELICKIEIMQKNLDFYRTAAADTEKRNNENE